MSIIWKSIQLKAAHFEPEPNKNQNQNNVKSVFYKVIMTINSVGTEYPHRELSVHFQCASACLPTKLAISVIQLLLT